MTAQNTRLNFINVLIKYFETLFEISLTYVFIVAALVLRRLRFELIAAFA